MGDMNSRLVQLYEQKWGAIKKLRSEHKDRLSHPLLIKVSRSYEESAKKLLIIGQQTANEWGSKKLEEPEGITELQNDYETFISDGMGPGPFWFTTKQLLAEFGLSNDCFVWSNLNRMDENGKEPKEEIEKEMVEQIPLLVEEIRICKPNFIVFFTGPYFDWIIKRTLSKVRFMKVNDNDPEREFAQIIFEEMPDIECYRTYHPNAMIKNKGKGAKYRDRILATIIAGFKK